MKVKAMIKAINDVNFYPESSSLMLRQKLAENLGINENMGIFSNGADNVLGLITFA